MVGEFIDDGVSASLNRPEDRRVVRYPSRVPAAVEERRSAVVHLSRAGVSIPRIMETVGLSRTSVVRIRRQHGLSRRQRPRLSEAQVDQARELLDDGAPISEVVRTLGCGRYQIDSRFPGRAWTIAQCIDHLRTLRSEPGNHSEDVIRAVNRRSKSRVSVRT